MKFCGHRWLENQVVADRTTSVWGNIKRYVSAVAKKEVKNPGTTFDVVKVFAADPVTPVQLACFSSIA